MHWSERFLQWSPASEHGACLDFFRHVQREQFGREVPAAIVPGGLLAIARELRTHAIELGWQEVSEPMHGDGVLMAHFKFATHIGIYVADLPKPAVLHCVGGSVGLHDFFHLDLHRWRRSGFYRPI